MKGSTYMRLLHYLRYQSERSDLWAEDLLNELVAKLGGSPKSNAVRGERGSAWPASEPSN